MAEITWLAQPAEPDIATRLRASGQDAMTELFHAHADAIYNFCFRRTADWHTAEDLTSQVFLTAWQNRHRAREHEGTLAPWLYGIANNLCRTHHRSRRRRDDAMLRLAADVATSQPDVTQRDDDALRIRTALDRVAELPADQQEVFFLVCWEGLDYAACAAALNLPVGTVASRLSRIRAALRIHDQENS